jgi:alginate O-acetyltransferase complex protein AlgI
MVFSSPIFLFLFLPVVLALYLVLPGGLRVRNAWLLFFSLVFYAWGEPVFIFLALGSTLLNYLLGLWLDGTADPARRKGVVALAIALNIGLLAFFKYTNFAVANVNSVLSALGRAPLHVPHVLLPIGISFFTFHALSYIIDVYRKKWPAARNPADVALYIFFFPQLIAGPILRWRAIAPQLSQRVITGAEFAEGVRRFVGGLAKKMLVANVVAVPVRDIFGLPANQLSGPVAWFGVVCYSVQLYFDFSGYSDMAVGLGKMFGFKFLENFRFPYVSQSVSDFWRRWHISLVTWFHDYLLVPLRGQGCSERREYVNLLIVFGICGLWHGASWPFVIWGLYHGVFLVLERTRFGTLVGRLPRPLRHIYALLVVLLGLVLFGSETFTQAAELFRAMFGFAAASATHQPLARYATNQVLWSLMAGCLFSAPLWPWIKTQCQRLGAAAPRPLQPLTNFAGYLLESALTVILFLISAAWLAGGTYNPFIYFRF